MQSSQEIAKTCPHCGKKDITSFSTCRFCSTRYDATKKTERFYQNEKLMLAVFIGILLPIGITYCMSLQKAARMQQLAPIVKSIQAVNRPRLIEFYATWCGPCRSYGPVVEECQARHAEKVDFQRFDIDDSNSVETRKIFEVTVVPTTYLFNRKGEEIALLKGYIDRAKLEKYMQELEADK